MCSTGLYLEIREMDEDEIITFYSICKSNSLHSLKLEHIRIIRRIGLGLLLVAVANGDEIVGTCIAYANFGLITGLAVSPNCTHPLWVQRILFEEACRGLPMKPIEMTIPETMRSYMISNGYKHRWDIHLYSAESKDIVPPSCSPSCSCNEYYIDLIIGDHGGDFLLHFIAPDGGIRNVEFSDTNDLSVVTLKLYCRQSLNLVGYGQINENNEGKLIIGPLLAPDENAAKVILRMLTLFLKRTLVNQSTIVLIYAVNRSETSILDSSRFLKVNPEWSRYYREEYHGFFSHSLLEDMNSTIYALSSLVLSTI